MPLDEPTRERIQTLVDSGDVLLFMKGNREAPQCGFSSTVVQILDRLIPDYGTFDVLSDPSVRDGVKEYSQWPTIPQLYVRGEFLGGCDIIQELYSTRELHEKLGVSAGAEAPPQIEVTPAAAESIRQAMGDAPPDHALHLGVDALYRSRLFMAPLEPGALPVLSNGIELHVDPLSAERAEGARIDLTRSGRNVAFQVHLPRAPEAPVAVEQMPVSELARRLQAGERFELFDVRSPEERDIAHIEGARLLDASEAARIEGLPRDTMLVFHCHHGGRSQAAAEHFAAMGFTRVFNVPGGIDAWAQEVDASARRY